MASTNPTERESSNPSRRPIDGRRRSASTSRTWASEAWASAPARLIAVVVLPSPTPGLETAITDMSPALCRCSTRCRSARYCSASRPAGATRLTRWLSTSSVGTAAPRRGAGILLAGLEAGGLDGAGLDGGGVNAEGAADATGATGDGDDAGAGDDAGGGGGGGGGATGWARSARSRCACSSAFANLLISSQDHGRSAPGRSGTGWRNRGPPAATQGA